jgi:hypothetical protein
MRFLQVALPVAAFLTATPALGQSAAVQRDARAVGVLQLSLGAMGGTVPADSTATGRITLVEGSKTQSGSIRILTRGTEESSVEIQTADERRAVTYSRGLAKEQTAGMDSEEQVSLELSASSQSPNFPLPFLNSMLSNPEAAFEYIGIEKIESGEAHHIRAWNTFQSKQRLQHLALFSEKHIWISVASGLPLKISYERRAARGAEPGIPVAVSFFDFRNIGGVLYPFRIEKSFNGSPWATITIDNVTFNTGLTAAQFQVH